MKTEVGGFKIVGSVINLINIAFDINEVIYIRKGGGAEELTEYYIEIMFKNGKNITIPYESDPDTCSSDFLIIKDKFMDIKMEDGQ